LLAGQKHLKFIKENEKTDPRMTDFLPGTASSAITKTTVDSSQPTTSSSSVDLSSFVAKNETLIAELCWTIKVINSHYSYKSCEDAGKIFQFMFPDSLIAKTFACAERKAAYLATFGIAPHFLTLLKERAKKQAGFVLLFDESMNNELQSSQMDVHIRFWNDFNVQTRYLTSCFMGHHTSEQIYEKLEVVIHDFGMSKMIQLSMDGPNVNWKLYGIMQESIEKESGKNLFNLGSCGLHILHNAFRDGCNAGAKWSIEYSLSSLRWLFKDSPARREDFTNVTAGCTTFPLNFCKHRWLENVSVAERALLLLPKLQVYVDAVKGKKIKEPTNKSFKELEGILCDKLFTARLNFFILVAREVEPFLKLYQTDKPMVPFLCADLANLIRNLMEKFITAEVLKEALSTIKLIKVDVTKQTNYIEVSKVKVGFITENILRYLKGSKKVSDRDVYEFRQECRSFLVKLLSKVLDKSPVKYPIVRYMSVLDPRTLIIDKEKSSSKLSSILKVMTEKKRISEQICDSILTEFSHFYDTMLQSHSEYFNSFNPAEDRLDSFYYDKLAKAEYSHLWEVCQLLLLLSHGQATVERGFSVNKEVTIENLSEQSLVAQRTIVDHVRSVGGVLNVNYSKELLLSASGARSKYQHYLDKKKEEKEKNKKNARKRVIMDDIVEIKAKKKRLEDDIEALTKSAEEYADKAESKGKVTLITKSNALRRSAKEKIETLGTIEKEIEEKMKQLQDTI
jgi:hypothetical protein